METKTERHLTGRHWWGLTVLALPTLLLSLDFSVLYLALPSLATDLAPTGSQELWIMDIYGFMTAGFLVTMGTLGDRIGRRRLLLIGAAVFGVTSVVAAFAPTPEVLIASRAVMGVAGAMVLPSTLALIATLFTDPRQLAFATSLWMSCFMGGLVIGPVIGGVLLSTFWWGSVFLLGVPVMALLLILGPRVLPEEHDPGAGRLDLVSVGLSLITVLGAVYALKELASHGWEASPALILGIALTAGMAFVRRQLILDSPLLDVGLFRDRVLSSTMTIWLLGGAVQGGVSFLMAQHLQAVLGLSPLAAGLALVPASVAMIAAILAAPALAQRFGIGRVMSAGLVVAALGAFIVAQVGTGELTPLLAGYSVSILGLGLPSGLVPGLILGAAPSHRAGSASALQETAGEFGMAAGVAIFGSIAASSYRDRLTASTTDAVPDRALDSISGAISAAEALSPSAAHDMVQAAQAAYAGGFTTAALVAAATFAALALLAATQVPRGADVVIQQQPDTPEARSSDVPARGEGAAER